MIARKLFIMKTYKFKMYSNHGNRELQQTIDSHAHVWNHFVALCRRCHAIYGKYPGKKGLMRHLTKLKRLPRFAHWNQLPSQSLQDVIDRLDKAYSKLFTDRKSGKRSGRPRFKRRKLYKSYTLKQAGWKLLQNNYIRIGKRIYRYFKSREVLGNPKRCTIKRDSVGDVWLIILTDHVDTDLESPTTGKSAGFDFGLKRYLTGSDYNDYESPQFFKRGINAIKRANRKHSRKVKRSKNRERARLNLARKHRKIANQRADFHWKLAHDLTDRYDWIALESLNLKGMKSLWGRKVSDLGFFDFMQKLKYVTSRKSREVRFIDKWYPSSKTCHVCGAINQELNLRDRTWQCPSCHTELDRDRNAALNIHRVGASTLSGEVVSPPSGG
jgi:putative transposase